MLNEFHFRESTKIELRVSTMEQIAFLNFCYTKANNINESIRQRHEDFLQADDFLFLEWVKRGVKIPGVKTDRSIRQINKEYRYALPVSVALYCCTAMQRVECSDFQQMFLNKLFEGLVNYGFSAKKLTVIQL